MSKKVLSCMLAIAMAATLTAVTVSAEDTQTRGTIYFDSTGMGGEAAAHRGVYYCYVWSDTEGDLFTWDSTSCKMTNLGDNMYSYDIPAVSSAGENKKADLMILHANGGAQTWETTFSDECIGDTIYVSEAVYEGGTHDSNIPKYFCKWRNNPAEGPYLSIASTGKITGDTLLKHETPESVVDEFIEDYRWHMEAEDEGYDNPEVLTDDYREKLIDEVTRIVYHIDPPLPPITPTEPITEAPTEAPTAEPTEVPTEAPTAKPTTAPTQAPTAKPTTAPTQAPTSGATNATSSNTSNGTVNTSQNSTLAVLASTLLTAVGVAYGMGKKREKNS
ncbi:MAG: hypothetical protein UE295_03080 [Acutalibacteraceae bacterium]|nr:hypothetical protein [Acutalibacteraceae bacterium]